MKQYILKFATLTLLIISSAYSSFGQGKSQKDMDPEVTEIWDPVPKVVSIINNVPSDAIVLFDGSNFDAWVNASGGKPEWSVSENAMTVKPKTGGISTKESFGDCQLHIEWRAPSVVKGNSQGRGNSGIFLMSRYELQVLDNYDNRTYSNGQASSIYKQTMPQVNACKAPGEWQTYDIIFTAPRFNDDGVRTIPGYITVLHNGVLTLNHVMIWGTTEYIGLPKNVAHGNAPITLQDHGDLVSYRNIWIRPL